jgi:hypothetical protein
VKTKNVDPVRLDDAAVQREAVDRRRHRVLADAPVHVPARSLARVAVVTGKDRLRRADEIRGAADHGRHERRHRLEDLAGRGARRELRRLRRIEHRQRGGEAVADLARLPVAPLRRELRVRARPRGEA